MFFRSWRICILFVTIYSAASVVGDPLPEASIASGLRQVDQASAVGQLPGDEPLSSISSAPTDVRNQARKEKSNYLILI